MGSNPQAARPARRITRTFPGHRSGELPGAAAEIAERRTAHLEPLLLDRPIREVLVSAYMQGILDAHQALTRGEKAA